MCQGYSDNLGYSDKWAVHMADNLWLTVDCQSNSDGQRYSDKGGP